MTLTVNDLVNEANQTICEEGRISNNPVVESTFYNILDCLKNYSWNHYPDYVPDTPRTVLVKFNNGIYELARFDLDEEQWYGHEGDPLNKTELKWMEIPK